MLGKHSGCAALADRAATLGHELTGEQLDRVFEDFKKLADKKKEIYDGDIAALVEGNLGESLGDEWRLVSYEVHASAVKPPAATITLDRAGKQHSTTVATGDGPLDALFRAVEDLVGKNVVVRDFRVQSATHGKDAQGESVVEVEYGDCLYRGRGVSTDTVEASIRAFLNAVNRVEAGIGQPITERPESV